MKTAGMVMSVIGGLMTLGGISQVLTKYDLSSSHDVSKAVGSIGVSIGILIVGLILYSKGNKG